MLYLTSSVASVAEHLYKNFLAEKGYTTVLFVDTAAEPEIAEGQDDDWLIKDLESLKDQGYQVDRYTFTGKTREEIEKKMDEYDILYMSGGTTVYLLEQLHKTDSFSLIKEKVQKGKPYIGTSAGSIIAGPRLADYFYKESSKPCLNLVNFTLMPHWGSPYFKDEYLGESAQNAYKDTQVPLLVLTDTQYVVVDDQGSMTIQEVKD